MLVLPKNCAKVLRDLTFSSNFEQLSLERASFEQLSEKLRERFWEISSNLWKALSGGCAPKEKFEIFIALTLRGQGCRQQLHCTYPNLPIGAG